ncbi:MAG: hypothetical protein DRJ05_02755 [Bacteroidetes bacterium]|nr:MAG: hypothetical protein DRJ05_02755 [Bacteroidota bacterium]
MNFSRCTNGFNWLLESPERMTCNSIGCSKAETYVQCICAYQGLKARYVSISYGLSALMPMDSMNIGFRKLHPMLLHLGALPLVLHTFNPIPKYQIWNFVIDLISAIVHNRTENVFN